MKSILFSVLLEFTQALLTQLLLNNCFWVFIRRYRLCFWAYFPQIEHPSRQHFEIFQRTIFLDLVLLQVVRSSASPLCDILLPTNKFSKLCQENIWLIPSNLEWLRPPELLERYHSRHGSDARMFVDGASKFDLVQGELGDCWLVAAVACLTTRAGLS